LELGSRRATGSNQQNKQTMLALRARARAPAGAAAFCSCSVAASSAWQPAARRRAGAPSASRAPPRAAAANAAASSSAAAPHDEQAARFATGLTFTSYEGNSWSVHFQHTGVRVLVDPWLVGDISFGDLTWCARAHF